MKTYFIMDFGVKISDLPQIIATTIEKSKDLLKGEIVACSVEKEIANEPMDVTILTATNHIEHVTLKLVEAKV